MTPHARRPAIWPVVSLALLAALFAAPVAHGQGGDAGTSAVERALAANQSNPALQQCLANSRAVEVFTQAVAAVDRSRDRSAPAYFNCSGIGASWQEIAPGACCEAFERDKRRSADAAWVALQQCGWRHLVEVRRPDYLRAAEKCLASANLAADTGPAATRPTPPVAGRAATNVWSGVRPFGDVQREIVGQDACAITGGPSWQVFDNSGRRRGVPGFLADRVRRGYALLDSRVWLQAALASLPAGLSVDQALARLAEGGPEGARQYVLFGDGFVRHYLPGASLAVPVGPEVELAGATGPAARGSGIRRVSSEHGSIRGTCNGGGDFIRFDERLSGPPRLLRAGFQAIAAREVRIELPGAAVAAVGGPARAVVDLAPNGAAAVLAVVGTLSVRDLATGEVVQLPAGEAALLWPGAGLSRATALDATRMRQASKPRMRGSIVLGPGQEWSGPLRIEQGQLPLEGRLVWDKPAGGAYQLEVHVNGRAVTEPVVNKMSPFRYADGRNYPYREPNTSRWMLFYSQDFEANNGPSGGGYEVKTDPGQAYRYVWDVRRLLSGTAPPQVRFRNMAAADGPTLELRLLSGASGERLGALPTDRSLGMPGSQPPVGLDQGQTPALPGAGTGGARLVVSVAPDVAPTGADELLWVFVQGEDAAGRLLPWKPSDPLVVTLTSSNLQVLRPYGSDGHLAKVRTTGVPRYGTFAPAGNGTTAITASAPGYAPATVSVSTKPYAVGGATRLRLHAAPLRVLVGERPIVVAQYLTAQGAPSLHGRRMNVTVEATSPDGASARATSLFFGDTYTAAQLSIDLAPTAGVTTLRASAPGFISEPVRVEIVTPTEPGVSAGGARPMWPPPPPSAAPVEPPPTTSPPSARGGSVIRNNDFGEPATGGRISNIVTARDVQQGAAVGISDQFSPEVNPIHVWFRLSGFAAGTALTTRWTWLGGASPLVIGTGEFVVTAGSDYGTFSYELASGKQWPAGDYRIEILRGSSLMGTALFTVTASR